MCLYLKLTHHSIAISYNSSLDFAVTLTTTNMLQQPKHKGTLLNLKHITYATVLLGLITDQQSSGLLVVQGTIITSNVYLSSYLQPDTRSIFKLKYFKLSLCLKKSKLKNWTLNQDTVEQLAWHRLAKSRALTTKLSFLRRNRILHEILIILFVIIWMLLFELFVIIWIFNFLYQC